MTFALNSHHMILIKAPVLKKIQLKIIKEDCCPSESDTDLQH